MNGTKWPRMTKWIRYSLIGVLTLCFGLNVMIVGAMILGGISSAPVPGDPFAAFAGIMPGTPRSGLEAYGFTCQQTNPHYSQNVYCSYQPSVGIFATVEAFADQYVVTEVDFIMRDDTLKVGNLMLLWGAPRIHPHSESINFIWQNGGGAMTEAENKSHLSLAVRKVFFMQ